MKGTKALARKSLWSQPWQGSSFYQMMILMIILGVAFDNMDQVTCLCILPMMHMEWNLSSILGPYMPAAALLLLGACLGAVFWGTIAERIGRKRTLMYTILLFTITNLIQMHSWNYVQFMITCFFMGIGVGGEIPIALTLLSEFMPAHVRTRIELAVGMLAIVLGYAFAASSAHFLLPVAGWKSLFYAQAIPALLVIVIRFQVPESSRYLHAVRQDIDAQYALPEIKCRTRSDGTFDAKDGIVGNEQRPPPAAGIRLLWRRCTRANQLFGFLSVFFQFTFLIWLLTRLKNPSYSDTQERQFPEGDELFCSSFGLCRSVSALQRWFEICADHLSDGGRVMFASVWRFSPPDCCAASAPGLRWRGYLLLWQHITRYLLALQEVYPAEVRGTGSGRVCSGSFIGPPVGGLLFYPGPSAQIDLVPY
jgi:MFS family permease